MSWAAEPSEALETHFVGYCAVDSGQIMVVDPCYVTDDDMGDMDGEPTGGLYDLVCRTTHQSYPIGGQFTASGTGGSAVAVSSGFGDGYYPVYVEVGDYGKWGQRVASLTIVFIEEPKEDHDG